MDNTTDDLRALSASDLLGDLRRHISMMAPHQKCREQGKLMLAATEEIARLRHGIDCASNALTDSILCSGNDAATNIHFVRKLRSLLSSPNSAETNPSE